MDHGRVQNVRRFSVNIMYALSKRLLPL